MRKRYVRLTAAALALVLPLAMTSVAVATPLAPLGDRPVLSKSGLSAASITPAAINGAVPLPASPVVGTVAGAVDLEMNGPAFDVFSFQLEDDEVLKATVTFSGGANAYLEAVGFVDSGEAEDPTEAFPIAYGTGAPSDGSIDRPFEVYIPAEIGSGEYYLALANYDSVAADYEVSWEILSGRSSATIERVAGADRYSVAEAVGLKAFPGWAGITDVIVASGDDRAMADPLSAAGLAGAWGAPILLVKPVLVNGKLPAQTERALANIRNANGGKVNIHVIGGTVSVPPAVYSRIVSFRGTGTHERISGNDRYSLSATMAKKARDVIVAKGGTVTDVLIANGETPGVFYDALAVSPIAYSQGVPMMLVKAGSVPTAVKNQLNTTFKGTHRYLVNNSTYLKAAVRTSVAQNDNPNSTPYNIVMPGPYDRTDAAWDIAEWGYMNGLLDRSTIAVANKLPDALTGGVAMGELGAPILYTGAAGLSGSTDLFLYWNKGALTRAYVLGGTASVSGAALQEIGFALEWPLD